MSPQDAAKKAAAEAAAAYVKDGMTVGLGTGSTVKFMVDELGRRVREEGLQIRGVPTSVATQMQATDVGIPLIDLDEVIAFDVTIDGADEVDPQLDLIKGLGGALLREKIVASLTKLQIIVVDPTKMVDKLGTRSPLPVEVLPFGVSVVKRKLEAMGLKPELRMRAGEPVVTDNDNLVLDVYFADGIADARQLELDLNNTPGVVENGLFLGMTQRVIIGDPEGGVREIARE